VVAGGGAAGLGSPACWRTLSFVLPSMRLISPDRGVCPVLTLLEKISATGSDSDCSRADPPCLPAMPEGDSPQAGGLGDSSCLRLGRSGRGGCASGAPHLDAACPAGRAHNLGCALRWRWTRAAGGLARPARWVPRANWRRQLPQGHSESTSAFNDSARRSRPDGRHQLGARGLPLWPASNCCARQGPAAPVRASGISPGGWGGDGPMPASASGTSSARPCAAMSACLRKALPSKRTAALPAAAGKPLCWRPHWLRLIDRANAVVASQWRRASADLLKRVRSGPVPCLRWAGLEPLVACTAIGLKGGAPPRNGGEEIPPFGSDSATGTRKRV